MPLYKKVSKLQVLGLLVDGAPEEEDLSEYPGGKQE